jgi:hypothetical protein
MPDWLYQYFGDVIQPLILMKDGSKLAQPATFIEVKPYAPASFWIHPPEVTFDLSHHHFDPHLFYRPRVFLWLPHFLIETLQCPSCRGALEKNGALAPRRIIDVDHSFYIVTWAYYCRKGCKSHFHGWSQRLLNSLPAWLHLSFPAVLSHQSGLSCNVISQLRVGNWHKMGPTGVRSLLLEMHTMRFNILQAQYMEALFEQVQAQQTTKNPDELQTSLHRYLVNNVPNFGDFGDVQKYAGFVPGASYLAMMMNKAIELEELDADQHTSCLAPDQLSIDDSHKVIFQFIIGLILTYALILMCRSTNMLPRLMVSQYLMLFGHA